MKILLAFFACIALVFVPLLFGQGGQGHTTTTESKSLDQQGPVSEVRMTTTETSPANWDWWKVIQFLGAMTGVQLFVTQFFVGPVVNKAIQPLLFLEAAFRIHLKEYGEFKGRVNGFIDGDIEQLRREHGKG